MATSGDNSFQITRDQLIKSSLEDVGAINYGVTPNANLLAMGQLELNKEVARLQSEGVRLWSRDWVDGINLVSGTQDYLLAGTDILNIDSVNITEGTSPNEVSYPVETMDIDKFFTEIGKLETTGRPTICAVENLISGNEFKFSLKMWPIPDSNYGYEYLAVKKLDGFTAGGETPAFPSTWYDPLQYGLSLRLGPKFGADPSMLGYFRKMYEEAKSIARRNEKTSRKKVMRGAYSYGRSR